MNSAMTAPTAEHDLPFDPPISLEEAAREIGETKDWFVRNRHDLIENHNFPPPLPKPGHPKWSRFNVRAWVRDPHGWNRNALVEHTHVALDPMLTDAARQTLSARTAALADQAD